MKLIKPVLSVVFAAVLSACSSTPEGMTNTVIAPADSLICCTSFAQLPLAELSDREDLRFDIDESSPVAKFAEGNSHFLAFKFSERSEKVTFTISSDLSNGKTFAPQVILFDKRFNIADEISLADFTVLPSDAFSRNRFIARYTANAIETPYMVIYTPANQLGYARKVDHPAKVRAIKLGEPMPLITDPVYTYQPTGTVSIELETSKLRPFKVTPVEAEQKSEVATRITAVQPETTKFYISAIENAVASGDIPKALSLLEEAKALNVEGAQEAFVKAVNKK